MSTATPSTALGQPAFDPGPLTRLARDLDDGGAGFVVELVERYRALLATRVARVVAALEAEDERETMDAVLSLKASSATVGASELHQLACELQEAVRRRDLGGAMACALQLQPAADRADAAFAAYSFA